MARIRWRREGCRRAVDTHTAYVALVVVVDVFIDVFKQTPSRRGGAEGDAGDSTLAWDEGAQTITDTE